MEEISKLHYSFKGIKFPIKVETNEMHINSVIKLSRIIVLYKETRKGVAKCFMDSSGCWFSEKEIDFVKYNETDTLTPKDNSFEDVVKPVLKYLCENHHPHTSVIITPTTAELSEGIKSIGIVDEYVLD